MSEARYIPGKQAMRETSSTQYSNRPAIAWGLLFLLAVVCIASTLPALAQMPAETVNEKALAVELPAAIPAAPAPLMAQASTEMALAPQQAPHAQSSSNSALAETDVHPTADLETLSRAWEKTMHHTLAPKGGCFKAVYPSKEWVEVQCAPPPKPHNVRPRRIKKEGGTEAVGGTASGSNDLVAQAPAGHFFTNVAGSFRVVNGVTSETNVQVPAYPYTGISGSNEFMLQINTNTYTYSSACGSYSACYPWVQYLMSTNDIASSADTGKSVVFVEYWLFNYGGAGNTSGPCPTGFSDIEADTEGYDCEQNSAANVIYDGQIPITDLDKLSMSASATAGGNDEATVTYKGVAYKATVPDSYTNISSIWNQAEFNVLGNWNGWQAQFNDGTVLILESDVTDGTTANPSCQFNAGTTGESNNLNFVPSTASPVCCTYGASDPRIEFMEVYDTSHTHTASCGSSSITGEPHITTVNDVYYNFQAAGEFIALLDSDGTEIQTRQTPIPTLAPGNYDPGNLNNDGLVSCLAMNTAVAARVGTHRVTYEPSFSAAYGKGPFDLRIDGKLTTLGAGGVDLGDGAKVKNSAAGGGIEMDFLDGKIVTAIPSGGYDSMQFLNVQFENSGFLSDGDGPAERGIAGAVPKGSWLPVLPSGKSVGSMPATLHERYVTLYNTFGNAWRVTSKNTLFDYAPGSSTASFTNTKWPVENATTCTIPNQTVVKPVNAEVAEEACKSVSNAKLHASCLFDVQATGDTGFADTYHASESAHKILSVKPIDAQHVVADTK
jgi:hypothetical protein